MMSTTSKTSSARKDVNDVSSKKTLGQLGIDVGADALFVQDGMRGYLDKNIEYVAAGEHMVVTMHTYSPNGEESKIRRKLAPYLLERCAQAVTRHGNGWFLFSKHEKGAKSYYALEPCDEKGVVKAEEPKKK